MAQERQVGKQEGRGEKEVQATKKKKKKQKLYKGLIREDMVCEGNRR